MTCPICKGEGVVLVPSADSRHPPCYQRCQCTLHQDIRENVERGMSGLLQAERVRKSPLMPFFNKSLWVTATKPWFMAHLRHVAVRQPPTWYFKVISDVDLVTAWLASAALKGIEIRDPDAQAVSMLYMTLVDLVVPPQLLILRLGVKAARNAATPEVLLEALGQRSHLNLPTWVWDQPNWKLQDGHMCYSPHVEEFLSEWPHHVAEGKTPAKSTYTTLSLDTPATAPPSTRPTLSEITPTRTRRKKSSEAPE